MDLCAIPEPGEPKNPEVTLPECHIRKVSKYLLEEQEARKLCRELIENNLVTID